MISWTPDITKRKSGGGVPVLLAPSAPEIASAASGWNIYLDHISEFNTLCWYNNKSDNVGENDGVDIGGRKLLVSPRSLLVG